MWLENQYCISVYYTTSTVCGASTYIYVLLNNRLTQSCRAGEENLIWLPVPTITMVILGCSRLNLSCSFLQQRAASCLCARLQLLSFTFINLKRYTLAVFLCVKHCLKKVYLFCTEWKRLYQQLFIYKTVVSYIYLSNTYGIVLHSKKYIHYLSLSKLPLPFNCIWNCKCYCPQKAEWF